MIIPTTHRLSKLTLSIYNTLINPIYYFKLFFFKISYLNITYFTTAEP